ncbi:CSD-domain-containing protein [Martensiomyces pterosporus]|nr:CSD-domain-containing protein [Martensiomyces pterosporus]
MATMKTGRVKFFNSQKGYGFVIPDEPIDGNAEVFVHHTVIHNGGGFKSLAEGEQVEFEVVKGPKGLQASRVTGPNGAYVRGDPYIRNRPKPLSAVGSNSSGSYYPYTHHFPASYSQVLPYTSPLTQPHYSAFPYSTTQAGGFVLPPVSATIGDSRALITGTGAGTGGSSQLPPPPPPQFYSAQAAPHIPQHMQHAAHQVPSMPVYEQFLRQQPPPQTYEAPSFAQPSAAGNVSGIPLPRPSPPPGFTSSSRQDSGSSQISGNQFAQFPE